MPSIPPSSALLLLLMLGLLTTTISAINDNAILQNTISNRLRNKNKATNEPTSSPNVPPTMPPYVSPYAYGAEAYDRTTLAPDFLTYPKATQYYETWSPTPFGNWQDFTAIQQLDSTWGPDYVKFENQYDSATEPIQWAQWRLAAASSVILGTVPYSHHHMHVWNVPNTPEWVNAGYTPGYGIDCSDYSHWNYAYGLGISLSTGIVAQSTQVSAEMYIANNPASPITVYGTILFDVQAGYKKNYTQMVLHDLQPGDLMYIRGDPAFTYPITHVIMFLGNLATDMNHVDQYLVTDSHGAEVYDSNNNLIPSGPRIRPFLQDSYYFSSFDHVVRWLPISTTPSPTSAPTA
jgi:cell wall-associated NlpC family hydrolase